MDTDKNGKKVTSRSDTGAPQGGVISPLLSNVYLHWFERAFHGPNGPATWAKAKIVRPPAGGTLTITATGITEYTGDWNVIDRGEISVPDSDSDPISITGVTCRRVSAANANAAAQTALA
jgi:retron-type reverse transcriptase